MTELEKRACDAMHQAFCRLRYFSRERLNERGREHLFRLADAAHNIPDALASNAYHRDSLARDVQAVEALLAESHSEACARYLERGAPRVPLIQRLRAAIGF